MGSSVHWGSMADVSRADLLRAARNRDGGWGYFASRQTWIEPTALAVLALGGDAAAHKFLLGAQLPDGSWPANPVAGESHAVTGLVMTALVRTGAGGDAVKRGAEWLVGVTGSENTLLFRTAHFLNPKVIEMDPSLKAWPWRKGSASWLEPTAHAMMGLRSAGTGGGIAAVHERLRDGEAMIFNRRCADGGWNHGSRRVMGHDSPSYPESTGIALYGLPKGKAEVRPAMELARRMFAGTKSPLGRAWLAVGLRWQGVTVEVGAPGAPEDVIVTALEEIARKGVLA